MGKIWHGTHSREAYSTIRKPVMNSIQELRVRPRKKGKKKKENKKKTRN